MLHDIVHEMEPSERFQYAQLLAYLASVDNSITNLEMAFFEQRLGQLSFRQKGKISSEIN